MPCPTCDHTMHNIGSGSACSQQWWCPRCGTIKTEYIGAHLDDNSSMPRLIHHCQKLADIYHGPDPDFEYTRGRVNQLMVEIRDCITDTWGRPPKEDTRADGRKSDSYNPEEDGVEIHNVCPICNRQIKTGKEACAMGMCPSLNLEEGGKK